MPPSTEFKLSNGILITLFIPRMIPLTSVTKTSFTDVTNPSKIVPPALKIPTMSFHVFCAKVLIPSHKFVNNVSIG